MFQRVLNHTVFSQGVADNALGHIEAGAFGSDVTMVSTMRALLYDRVSTETSVRTFVRSRDMSIEGLQTADNDTLCHHLFSTPSANTLRIANCRVSDACWTALMARLDDPANGLLAPYEGMKELTDIRDFIAKHFTLRVFSSEVMKHTIVLVRDMDMRAWHWLQSVYPRLMPWLFREKPLNEKDIALLSTLTRTSSSNYEQKLMEAWDSAGIQSVWLRTQLEGLEAKVRLRQIERANQEVNDYRRRIGEMMTQLESLIKAKDKANASLLGLIAASKDANDNELSDYFASNKRLQLLDVRDDLVEFEVITYLDNYDPDMAEVMIENRNSILYDLGRCPEPMKVADDWALLLSAVLSPDPVFKIRSYAAFRLRLGGGIEALSTYHSSDYTRLPNPHIFHYACLGDYERFIYEQLAEGDTLGAIAQCEASARSFNVGDVPVTRAFVNDLANARGKVLELDDGTLMTPAEAIAYLKERK